MLLQIQRLTILLLAVCLVSIIGCDSAQTDSVASSELSGSVTRNDSQSLAASPEADSLKGGPGDNLELCDPPLITIVSPEGGQEFEQNSTISYVWIPGNPWWDPNARIKRYTHWVSVDVPIHFSIIGFYPPSTDGIIFNTFVRRQISAGNWTSWEKLDDLSGGVLGGEVTRNVEKNLFLRWRSWNEGTTPPNAPSITGLAQVRVKAYRRCILPSEPHDRVVSSTWTTRTRQFEIVSGSSIALGETVTSGFSEL